MAWFSRKFDSMPTEEQRYAAANRTPQRNIAAPRSPVLTEQQAEVSAKYEERTKAKRDRIKKVGTIRRIGPSTFETHDWEIDVEHPDGRGRVVENGVRHEGTLAGFTLAELCAIAHGRNCRNCI